MQKNLVCFLAF